MRSILCFAAIAAASASSYAQNTILVPNGTTATTDAISSTAYPWGRAAAVIHVQYCFDSTHFTAQGITGPMRFLRMKWRANGGAVAATVGGTYSTATVDMSTSAFDQAAITTTFANNHGPDRANVYTGAVTVLPTLATTTGVANIFYVDITLATPFTYDPTSGNDLLIDVAIPAAVWTGGTAAALDCATTGSLVSRMYNLTSDTALTGSFQANVAPVIEFDWLPPSGLFAGFTATPTTGGTPLNVQFTNTSFSSDPGGITSYAWDFDGDSVIDSTLQNPSFIYNTCGSFNVSLTVTDAAHPPNTLTRPNYVVTDIVTPDFTSALIGPGLVQFTDTSTPTPTSWAWDLNGDNVVDSTLQNPTWSYGASCSAPVNVTLTANRLCRGPYSITKPTTPSTTATTTVAGGNGTSSATYVGNLFDVVVNNPTGINICALTVTPYSFGGPFNVFLYVTPGTYVGRDTQAAAWRLIGQGSGTAVLGGAFTNPIQIYVPLTSTAYLAPGNYGVAVYIQNPAGSANLAYSNGPLGPFGNSDITLFPSPATAPGVSRTVLFGSSGVASRVWNGRFHYSTCSGSGEAGYGWFGAGCAGTMPLSNQSYTSRPVLGGALNVSVNNLPVNGAIMALGLSRTASPFGPLPLDLTPFGAPGCSALVSPDATFFLTGAGGTANFSFPLPNSPSFSCIPFYTQAVVIDPTANGFGAVLGDAWAAMTGTN